MQPATLPVRLEVRVRALIAIPLLFCLTANAKDTTVPLRPLTYPLDGKLSDAPIAHFRKLYVDPATFVASLKPSAPPSVPAAATANTPGGVSATAINTPPTGNLLVLNDRGSPADVAINGTKVGQIGPSVYGVVGPVPSGTYQVTITWSNGLSLTSDVATTTAPPPGAWGGAPPAMDAPTGPHSSKATAP